MSAAAVIDADFVAVRAASKAWLTSIQPASGDLPGWDDPTDGFSDLYESGGARTARFDRSYRRSALGRMAGAGRCP